LQSLGFLLDRHHGATGSGWLIKSGALPQSDLEDSAGDDLTQGPGCGTLDFSQALE